MKALEYKTDLKPQRKFQLKATLFFGACLLCFNILKPVNAQTNHRTAAEYAVKAAYIYNILRFVNWDKNNPLAQTDTLNICLLDNNPFKHYLEPIKTKKVGKKKISLKTISDTNQSSKCHLIFVDKSSRFNEDTLKNYYQTNDNILVGNDIDFVKKGGLFGFYIENNKVKLGANKFAITNTELNISSLLIEVCQLYGDPQ